MVSNVRANSPVHRKVGQQHEFRQLRIVGDVIEPGGDDEFVQLVIDERCAERRKGMRPAGQHRQRDAVAAAFDARRKEAQQARRCRARPHQPGTGIASEHRRGRACEGRLIEHVGFERQRRQRPPFVDDGIKVRQRPPLHTKKQFDRAVHGSALRAAPDEDVEAEPFFGHHEQPDGFEDQCNRGGDGGAGRSQ